jgi:hypothetical protein
LTTAGRHDDRRHRREVEGADAVATGTDDVDGLGPDLLGGQPAAVLQHHVGQLGHFCCGWPLHLHGHGERR